MMRRVLVCLFLAVSFVAPMTLLYSRADAVVGFSPYGDSQPVIGSGSGATPATGIVLTE